MKNLMKHFVHYGEILYPAILHFSKCTVNENCAFFKKDPVRLHSVFVI